MQKWLERFGLLFPLFSSFSVLFFVLQCTFLLQFDSKLFAGSLLIASVNILSGFSIIWIFSTTIFYLIPIKWLRGIKLIFFILLYISLLGTALCDQYLLLAHERLDASFFLFDWTEIWMISDPVNRFTWALALGLILLLVAPFILIKTLEKYRLPVTRMLILVLFFILIGFIPTSREVAYLNENRFVYFVKQSINSLVFYHKPPNATRKDFYELSSAFYGGHKPLDPRFPLLHRLNEKSVLSEFLHKTSNNKLPHIKIIIVESMSSDLFGQRGNNTGVIMPFMDSLSRHSLYFPNGFSTYQRTHNVLPAVLASVPNTIDGNVFQQLPFPRHYSLFNLLKKNYSTQFYCGVRLEYLNMAGLMSHYKTSYLSKCWNKSLERHKESVGSAWGYPDEDLFKQAQFDDSCQFNKLNKPLFKIFLTISSHDPFIYPNKSKWEQFVLNKSTSIKDKRLRHMIRSQAASFGAFSYVDSTLQRFFESEKKSSNYNNTVYIITGDHGTELYRRNSLSKYNVPIVVYSPLLKKAATSQALVSHNDLAPTILNYLKTVYRIQAPDSVPFVGKELKVRSTFNPDRSFVFTTNKLKTTELLANKLVYVSGNPSRLDSLLEIREINNKKKSKWISQQLRAYQSFSNYTLLQNKVIDSLSYVKWTGDFKQFSLDNRKEFPIINIDKQMTYLASQKYSLNKSLKIELLATIRCANKSSINSAPTLVIQSKKSKYLSFKWTINRQIKCHFSGTFKRNSKNQIVYHMEFNPKEIAKLKKEKKIHLYFLNEEKKNVELTNVKVNFYFSIK
jgi:phosphoglycerol transferase MdoB-like AlkP superfamily enzyme